MKSNQVDYSDVEARRSAASRRRMTPGRRLMYAVGLPLLRLILWVLHTSYRYVPPIGGDRADRIVSSLDPEFRW